MSLFFTKKHQTFDELFKDALRWGVISRPENTVIEKTQVSYHNNLFNAYIENKFIVELSNENYSEYLSIEHFIDYLFPSKNIMERLTFKTTLIDKAMNEKVLFFNYTTGHFPSPDSDFDKFMEMEQIMREIKFERELKETSKEKIKEFIEFHLRDYMRKGGIESIFINKLNSINLSGLDKYQKDEFLQFIEKRVPIEKIDWLSIFGSIDIDSELDPQVFKINTFKQQENYFSKASFSLTLKQLQSFKKETILLSTKRKLEYINSRNIEPPKFPNSGSPLFNQTVFEADSNYYEFLTRYKLLLGSNAMSQQSELSKEQYQPDENNILTSSIEDWLFEFKEIMSEQDYDVLISALTAYFKTGTFPKIKKQIKVGKVNKKLFGWALNQIYRAENAGVLSKEYLLFAKKNISLFAEVAFDETDILNSNLYKYFTTKTK